MPMKRQAIIRGIAIAGVFGIVLSALLPVLGSF